jgi:hypothetical protein
MKDIFHLYTSHCVFHPPLFESVPFNYVKVSTMVSTNKKLSKCYFEFTMRCRHKCLEVERKKGVFVSASGTSARSTLLYDR